MRCHLLVSVVLLAGCGSGNEIDGTIQGNTITFQSGFVTELDRMELISLTDIPSACSTFESVTEVTSSNTLNFDPFNSGGPVIPGTYTVGGNPLNVFATFAHVDDSCSSRADDATSGTVTITAFDLSSGGSARGTFDLHFGNDHVTGKFDVSTCSSTLDPGSTTGNCP